MQRLGCEHLRTLYNLSAPPLWTAMSMHEPHVVERSCSYCLGLAASCGNGKPELHLTRPDATSKES